MIADILAFQNAMMPQDSRPSAPLRVTGKTSIIEICPQMPVPRYEQILGFSILTIIAYNKFRIAQPCFSFSDSALYFIKEIS